MAAAIAATSAPAAAASDFDFSAPLLAPHSEPGTLSYEHPPTPPIGPVFMTLLSPPGTSSSAFQSLFFLRSIARWISIVSTSSSQVRLCGWCGG
jgi:hypothetical protein